ncbi:MAG: rhodanese-like domain-containing protein [Myxococcota bacterium]
MLRTLLASLMVVAIVGCGDDTTGDSGSGGTAGTGGAAATGGVGASGGDAGSGGAGGDDGPSTPIVVDVDWLMDNVLDPDLQLVDTRAESAFQASRIPGAIHLRPEELAATENGVASQVAPPDIAEPVLEAAGLEEGTTVVVYGEPPEFDPARIVWTLRYYQHGDVRYLDGGYAAWVDAGGEVDDDLPTESPTEYDIDEVDTSMRVTSDFVLDGIGDEPFDMATIQLVDARSAFEYDASRIPTARLVEWADNLDGGFLRSFDEIAELHEGLDGSTTTVTYCLIGWRGSVAWLVLEYLGYEDVRLYDGSWAEWGSGDFPVEP